MFSNLSIQLPRFARELDEWCLSHFQIRFSFLSLCLWFSLLSSCSLFEVWSWTWKRKKRRRKMTYRPAAGFAVGKTQNSWMTDFPRPSLVQARTRSVRRANGARSEPKPTAPYFSTAATGMSPISLTQRMLPLTSLNLVDALRPKLSCTGNTRTSGAVRQLPGYGHSHTQRVHWRWSNGKWSKVIF